MTPYSASNEALVPDATDSDVENTLCTIDCIAFHIYDSATNIDYFKNYITEMGTKYGKPTWMTEVCACPHPLPRNTLTSRT